MARSSSTSSLPPDAAQTLLLRQAIAALRGRQPAEAERLAAEVYRSAPRVVLAAQILGEALMIQARYDEAIAPLQAAAALAGDAATTLLLAKALEAAGKAVDALSTFRRAASCRPAFIPAFLELGERLRRAGDLDGADRIFADGLAVDPTAAVLHIGLAYVALDRGDRAKARAQFQTVHDRWPGRADAFAGLARVSALEGDHLRAAEHWRAYIAAQPSDTQARIELARQLLDSDERIEAEAIIRSAIDADPALEMPAIASLAASSRGRAFLRPSAARRFVRSGF